MMHGESQIKNDLLFICLRWFSCLSDLPLTYNFKISPRQSNSEFLKTNSNFHTICTHIFNVCTFVMYVPVYTNMIYLLTAIGLSPGGSSTVHIYTKTIHRTIQNKQCIEQQNNWKSAGRAPSWLVIPWHLPYNRGKSTEKSVRVAASKNT